MCKSTVCNVFILHMINFLPCLGRNRSLVACKFLIVSTIYTIPTPVGNSIDIVSSYRNDLNTMGVTLNCVVFHDFRNLLACTTPWSTNGF